MEKPHIAPRVVRVEALAELGARLATVRVIIFLATTTSHVHTVLTILVHPSVAVRIVGKVLAWVLGRRIQ